MGFSDFDVLLSDSPPSAQVIMAAGSPGTRRFPLDVNIDALVGEADRLLARPNTSEQAFKEFGAKLFGIVFSDDIRAELVRSLERCAGRGEIMRIRLRFDGASLARLPWELLYTASERFLSTSARLTMCRIIQVSPAAPLTVEPPIRLLVISCAPQGFAKLNHREERLRLERALEYLVGHKHAEVEFIPSAGKSETLERLQNAEFHVLHFIGHGDVREDGGVVFFEDGAGRSDTVDADLFARLAAVCPTLRLVVLNACSTAREPSRKAFSSVASQLVSYGVPAVVAMQTPIEDDVAIAFSGTLYGRLAAGEPIDRAMTKVRQRLQVEHCANRAAFCIPVLYMQPADGRLFDLGSSDRSLMVKAAQNAEQLRVNAEALADWKDLHHELQLVAKDVARALDLSKSSLGLDLLTEAWEDIEADIKDRLLPFAGDRVRFIGRRYSTTEAGSFGEEWAGRASTTAVRIRNLLSSSIPTGASAVRAEMITFHALFAKHVRFTNRTMLEIEAANRAIAAELIPVIEALAQSQFAAGLHWEAIRSNIADLRVDLARIEEWLTFHDVYDSLQGRVESLAVQTASLEDNDTALMLWLSVKDTIVETLLQRAARILHIGAAYAEHEDGLVGEPWAVDIKRIADRLDKCLEARNISASANETKSLARQIARHYVQLDGSVKQEIGRFRANCTQLYARITA